MSLIGDIVGAVGNVAFQSAIDTVCPEAEMLPALSNLATSALGGSLGQTIGELGQQCGMPNFVINGAKSAVSQVVSQLQQAVDPSSLDQVAQQAGPAVTDLVSSIIGDFKDTFQNYLNESNADGKGGGKGGSAGGAGGGGAIGFRELAAILAELEQKQAKNVQNAVQKASDALGVDSSQQGAEQQQFQAMEESKAEAQIFQALSSAISEVMKNFVGALNTAARGG